MVQYGVLFAIVMAALIGMRVYMERALQGRYRQSADLFGLGEQYEKGVTRVTENSNYLHLDPTTTPSSDTCANLSSRIAALRRRIDGYVLPNGEPVTGLREAADSLLAAAADLELKADSLPAAQAAALRQTAQDLRNRVVGPGGLQEQMDTLNGRIDTLSNLYNQKGCQPPLP